MKKIIIMIAMSSFSSIHRASSCSVFSIDVFSHKSFQKNSVDNVLGARTMDFEIDAEMCPKKGLKGDQNTSHINVAQDQLDQDKTKQWETQYNFIGMPLGLSGQIVDGINTEGLYMGGLYLPGETKYPKYDASKEEALGVLDLVNYVLDTSRSVQDSNR